jgi:hypothetical protein
MSVAFSPTENGWPGSLDTTVVVEHHDWAAARHTQRPQVMVNSVIFGRRTMACFRQFDGTVRVWRMPSQSWK